MGYDMTFERTPETVQAAIAAARAKLHTLRTQNADQTEVMKADAEFWAAQSNYFRLNISGMALVVDLMYKTGMGYDSEPDVEAPRCDCPEDRLTEGCEVLEHQQADDAYLRSGVLDRPGIALHKFGSNDGWHVTDLECLGAVAQWIRWCDQQQLPYDWVPTSPNGERLTIWPSWVKWLEAAGSAGGFRVY